MIDRQGKGRDCRDGALVEWGPVPRWNRRPWWQLRPDARPYRLDGFNDLW